MLTIIIVSIIIMSMMAMAITQVSIIAVKDGNSKVLWSAVVGWCW